MLHGAKSSYDHMVSTPQCIGTLEAGIVDYKDSMSKSGKDNQKETNTMADTKMCGAE